MTVPVSELQKLAPSAIIELFEIHLVTAIHGANTVFRFHAGTNAVNNGNIVWAGNSYQAFPVEATGFEYNGNGQLPRPKLVISNVLRFVTSILLVVNETSPGNDLNGAKLETPIQINEKDKKFRLVENQPYFKRDVIVYMIQKKSAKFEVFYDAYDKYLLGYREVNKDYVKFEKNYSKINIIYSYNSK